MTIEKPQTLVGRVALITGGGSGIGQGAAMALAGEGAAIAVADINPEAAAETTRRLHAAGARAVAVTMDVTDIASVETGFLAAVQALGPVDILVCSAGRNEHSPAGNTILNMDLESWNRLINLNLNGTVYTCRVAAAGMVARHWGRIIMIGSAAGYRLGPGGGGYAVAKAATAAFTKILARELAESHVTVNAVIPFFVDTPMLRRQFPSDAQLTAQMAEGPLANPMHVVLQVQDQVEAILYLCKESGRYITGQALHINGGSFMP
jgi:NAD(P)-dependent dehydrogenase (short-subunit alcohol dehydrogenase family)